MYRLILSGVVAALLAGCAARPPQPAPQVFRAAAVPIYSNAVFEPGRIVGQWQQVAAFAAPDAPACAAGQIVISGGPAGLSHDARLCVSGGQVTSSGALPITGPGRMTPARADPALATEWWVLWVDTGYRTLVIGAPSGGFGFILNRDGPLPADRLAAAREVLDFNGYDLTRLQVFAN